MSDLSRLIKVFLDLVQINTQSVYPYDHLPSNPGEMKAISYIQDTLDFIGADQCKIYDHGTLAITLPASPGFESEPVIAFSAHVDTSPGASGVVNPIIHQYIEGDIHLPKNGVLIPATSPSLTALRKRGGGSVISGDGTSLLGADDKAGVAALMELIYRIKEQNIAHSKLLFLFTTDEEIGEFGGDLPKSLIESLHLLWTVDGTTMGTLVTGSQKIIRNTFTVTSLPEPLVGERQISIDFKGIAGHSGLNPELFLPANSAACDFLTILMAADCSSVPVFLQGGPSFTSLIFADNGRFDYRSSLDKVLKKHPGVTVTIEEMPLGLNQMSIASIRNIAQLGKIIFDRCPVTTHRGPNGRGVINCLMVKPAENDPGSYKMVIAIRDDTSRGLKMMEDVLSSIESEILDQLDAGLSMTKEREILCENVASAIIGKEELLIPMKRAMSENHIEVIEEFGCCGTDGGMLNVTYPDVVCPNLGTGAELLHCAQEHISIDDLESLADILTAYVRNLRRGSSMSSS